MVDIALHTSSDVLLFKAIIDPLLTPNGQFQLGFLVKVNE